MNTPKSTHFEQLCIPSLFVLVFIGGWMLEFCILFFGPKMIIQSTKGPKTINLKGEISNDKTDKIIETKYIT